MRRFKFRAFDKEKMVMIYDDSQEAGEIYDLPIGARIHNTVWAIGNHYKTLMQFTEYTDCDHIDIYEGDIINGTPIFHERILNYNKSITEKEIYFTAGSFYVECDNGNPILLSNVFSMKVLYNKFTSGKTNGVAIPL